MLKISSLALPASLLGFLAGLTAAQSSGSGSGSGSMQDLGSVLANKPNVSTYYQLIQKYPDILLQLPSYAGVTIIAPNNEAFDKYNGWDNNNATLVTNILEYHILQGTVATASITEGMPYFASTLMKDPAYANVTGGQRVIINKQPGNLVVYTSGDGSRSTQLEEDITFSGGLIQMVDTLLVPPARLEHVARDAYQNLRSFLGALYETELVDTFATHQNVTIFAPYDTAFQLLSGTLSGLSTDELKSVLEYHIIPGQVLMSTDLVNGTTWSTLAANVSDDSSPTKVTITVAGNNRYIDSAQLTQPDILIANGVIHMIDNVLNPETPDVKPKPELGTQAAAFPLSGSTSTGTRVAVPFTTALPCTHDCPGTTTTAAANITDATATVSGSKTTSTRLSTSESDGAGAGLPRCTGLTGAMGVVGAGLLGVAAVI